MSPQARCSLYATGLFDVRPDDKVVCHVFIQAQAPSFAKRVGAWREGDVEQSCYDAYLIRGLRSHQHAYPRFGFFSKSMLIAAGALLKIDVELMCYNASFVEGLSSNQHTYHWFWFFLQSLLIAAGL